MAFNSNTRRPAQQGTSKPAYNNKPKSDKPFPAKVGGLWKNKNEQTKRVTLNGKFEIDGLVYSFFTMDNAEYKKQNENAPDFTIHLTEYIDGRPNPAPAKEYKPKGNYQGNSGNSGGFKKVNRPAPAPAPQEQEAQEEQQEENEGGGW